MSGRRPFRTVNRMVAGRSAVAAGRVLRDTEIRSAVVAADTAVAAIKTPKRAVAMRSIDPLHRLAHTRSACVTVPCGNPPGRVRFRT